MKFTFSLALLPVLILLGCKPAAEKETSEEITSEAGAADCGTEFFYGGRTICLPAFEGYEELYSDSLVTARFRPLNTGNLILGLYLYPSMYDTLKVNPSAIFDDYYKVYAFSKKSEYFANDAAITEAEITWAEELKKAGKVDLENLDNALPAQGAIIIDQYRNDDYMATSIQLTRLPYEGGEKIAIVTMNTLALRTKLVFFSYYMFYDGPQSIALAKKRNDAFGKAMQEANY
jgi:hypothetical protein